MLTLFPKFKKRMIIFEVVYVALMVTLYVLKPTASPIALALMLIVGGLFIAAAQYINAVNNPAIFAQYDQLGDLSSGDIIVESSKRYKSMSPYDLLEYQTDKNSSSGSSSDTFSRIPQTPSCIRWFACTSPTPMRRRAALTRR